MTGLASAAQVCERHNMIAFVWTGPFRIADLLARSIDDAQPMPPHADGVYLVTRRTWKRAPSPACVPLYVGGNTTERARFRKRVGELILAMHGLFDKHSGGRSLHAWCRRERVSPGDLYIAWATGKRWCNRCAEIEIATILAPEWSKRAPILNKVKPGRCARQGIDGPLRVQRPKGC